MKAVIAVGHMDMCIAGAELFARLQFESPTAVLVHTVEPVLPDGGFLPDTSTSPIVQIQNDRREDGEKRMASVTEILGKLNVPCESVTRFGNPAHEVTGVAREIEADMIVTGSTQKGRIESFVMGSVTKALVADALRSILVGKTAIEHDGKINAVLATDHSDYANQCIELLARFAPGGLGKVTVVTADTTDENVAAAMKAENPEGLGTEDILRRKNEAVVKSIQGMCTETGSVVLRGAANEVINAAMTETGADLLIIGAQGKGFLERFVMGSTAMHMVGNSPWNTLVLRV